MTKEFTHIGIGMLDEAAKNLLKFNERIDEKKYRKPEGANKFYRKNGFVPAKHIPIYGNEVSNVHVKEGVCRVHRCKI